MILTRCCTGPQARRGVDFSILTVIGASCGIGQAMQNTGLAHDISHFILETFQSMGPWALLGCVYLLTSVFTACMTNNAAAVLMFPIAVGLAQEGGINPMPFVVPSRSDIIPITVVYLSIGVNDSHPADVERRPPSA